MTRRNALTLFNKNFNGFPYVTNLPTGWVNSSTCYTDNSVRALQGPLCSFSSCFSH